MQSGITLPHLSERLWVRHLVTCL